VYPLELDVNLGYTGSGRYGFDDITLGYIGSGGLTAKNQSIAGIATKSYFLGLFGLTPRPQNFTSFNDPIPSFMQNLHTQSKIPSLSWSYTAGNQYRMLHPGFPSLLKLSARIFIGGQANCIFVQDLTTKSLEV
jgi:hypothetical protein